MIDIKQIIIKEMTVVTIIKIKISSDHDLN